MSGKRFKKDRRKKLRERKKWDKEKQKYTNPTVYTNFDEKDEIRK